MRFAGEVLTPDDEDIKGYRPIPKFAGMNNQPVALYGAHNSARIVAQQGVFTIFGRDAKPMDDAFTTDNFPANCLIRIILNKSVIRPLRKPLLNHGITESVVFPDLVCWFSVKW